MAISLLPPRVPRAHGKPGPELPDHEPRRFTRLVLGHGHVRETAFAGRLQASSRAALDLAESLFPCLPLWYPVWDDLPA